MTTGAEASARIDRRIEQLGGWRGETLRQVRQLIHQADPEVVEVWKWEKPTSPGVPVWEHAGGICTGEAYQRVVKLTFHHGASLSDPARLFNASLRGKVRRAIDIHEGETLDPAGFQMSARSGLSRRRRRHPCR